MASHIRRFTDRTLKYEDNLTSAQHGANARGDGSVRAARLAKRMGSGAARKRDGAALEAAKNVLRRTGKAVYACYVDEGKRGGDMIRVGTKKFTAAQVLAMAAEIVRREAERNNELRALHGLGPK